MALLVLDNRIKDVIEELDLEVGAAYEIQNTGGEPVYYQDTSAAQYDTGEGFHRLKPDVFIPRTYRVSEGIKLFMWTAHLGQITVSRVR